ncbi:MAG: Ig-like domain-containing protein [Pirellulales bacterium]
MLAALPVLDNSADPTLGQTQEDAGTPTGVVGTLVSALIDTDGPLDNFSDADGDLPGIAITGVNLQEGTLWSSENNGTGWQQVGTVSDASPRLLAADAGTRLYFQPAADFSGAINDVITFKAWDRTFILQQLGTDIDGEAAGDESGRTVSMSADGQTVAIGASGNDDNGIDSGHVRVYQWTGSAWQQQGADIDGEAAGDEAGKWNSLSLSSDGQMVAIGALYNDGNGNDSGHVRIYQWSGSAWQQLGADIDGEAAGDASGFAVSLSSDGQTVATGALYNGGNGALAGHVRIHQWTGSEWQQLGADIDGEAAGDNVHSVSLSSDGQTVAIGARRNDGNGTDSGSTRVYQWTGSAWQQLGSDIDGEAAEDQSGYSLSLSSDGQIVAIGALYNDGNGTDSGSTRVYQWTGSAWQQVGSDIDGEAAEDLSGVSLSLSSNGQTVAIAAHSNDASGDRAGQVRIYDWSGSEWEQLGADIDGEAADDLSGGSVSLSSDGQTVAVGAMFNDGNGVDSGHVRIYRAYSVQSTAADTVGVTIAPVNDAPTLDAFADLTIDEDAAEQTVNLSGISAGSGESQILKITAASSNTSLIPDPDIAYTSANPTGTLAFTPLAHQSGTATITVTVEDAGLDNDLATTGDNATFSRTFDVIVNPINDDPTLDAISDLTIDEDAAQETVNLAGISAGLSETQTLRVTATSNNTGLIPNPTVTFTSADTTGSLVFTPGADQSGTATVTVTVEDAGLDGDLATTSDNATFSRTFDVVVNPINNDPTLDSLDNMTIDEDAAQQTVMLTGITAGGSESQPLRINATSSNTSLIPDPTVTYASPDTTGSLSFTPVADAFGVTTITVTVEDGGLDGDLATATDNLNFSRTFDVTVVPINDSPSFFELTDFAVAEDSGEFTIDLQGIVADSGCLANHIINGDFLQGNSGFNSEYTFLGESNFPNSSFGYSIGTSGDHAGDGRMFVGNSVNHASTTTGNQLLFPIAWSQTVPVKQNATYEFSAWAKEVTNTSNPSILEFSINGTPMGVLDPTGVAASIWRQFVVDWQSGDSTTALLEIVEIGGRTQTPGGGNDFALDDISFVGNCEGRESQPLRLAAESDDIALIPEPAVFYTSPATIGSLILEPAPDAVGTATITVTVEDGGLDLDLATTSDNAIFNRSFEVTVNPVNDDPTLDSLDNLTIDEDAAEQTVNLTGITAGADEAQALRVTATSDNTGLILDPAVFYTSANPTGTLAFTPEANQSGTATITVKVEDAGLDNDFATAADNENFIRTFVVVAKAINDPPTLSALDNLELDEDAPLQTVQLAGISSGPLESEALRITATSDNTNVIPGPAITYTSGDSTGSLSFTPVANESGIATITVTVEDAGLDNDFATVADNSQYSQGFVVAVGMSTFVVDPNVITLELRGHDQTLSIFRQTDDISLELEDGLWSGLEVGGVTGHNSPTLIMPASKLRDRVEIITTSDQSFYTPTSNLWVLGAWDPIESPMFRPMVLDSDRQSIFHVAGQKPWKNFVSPHDITNDGTTSVLDALTIINELSRGTFVDLNTNQLTPPSELSEWPGVYYDTNGDDRGTVLDALLVINELARTSNSSGEGELADVAIQEWSRDLTPLSTATKTSEQLTQNPNSRSRIFTSSSEAASYFGSPQVVDAEYESMGSDSLKKLDESLLTLLAE